MIGRIVQCNFACSSRPTPALDVAFGLFLIFVIFSKFASEETTALMIVRYYV